MHHDIEHVYWYEVMHDLVSLILSLAECNINFHVQSVQCFFFYQVAKMQESTCMLFFSPRCQPGKYMYAR